MVKKGYLNNISSEICIFLTIKNKFFFNFLEKMSHELLREDDNSIRKRNLLLESTNINDEYKQQNPKNLLQKGKRTCGAISSSATSASSDDEDPLTVVKEKRLNKLHRILPQSSDKLGSYVDKLLSHLPERFLKFIFYLITFHFRWRNWVVRGILSVSFTFS